MLLFPRMTITKQGQSLLGLCRGGLVGIIHSGLILFMVGPRRVDTNTVYSGPITVHSGPTVL